MAPRHRRGLYSLLIPLVGLGWVCRGLIKGELFFERDQLLLFLPLKRYLAQRLAAGDLPAWWPWDGLGQPLVALPVVSAFHPSTAAYLALPFEWAFNFQTLLPFPVALLGAWYLGRTLGLGRWGAALAAGLFTGGFYFVALAEFTSMHLAAMTLPWVWREAIRVARSPRAPGLWLALATANLLLGGDPMLLELAAIGTLVLVLGSGAPARTRRLLRVGLWAALGVLLAAVQWVPMLHTFAESPRSSGLGIDVADFWALRGEHLRGVLLPGSFAPESFFFESTYLGPFVLVLAAWGASRRWRWRWPLLGICLMALVLAGGRALLLWQIFSLLVPGWSGFQFPAKTLSLVALCVALLAGRGALLAARRFPRRRAVVGAALVLVVSGDQLLHGARIDTRPWSELVEPPAAAALRAAGVGLGAQRYQQAWAPAPNTVQHEGLRNLSVAPVMGALWGLPTAGPYLQAYTRRVYDVTIADKEGWLSRRATLFGVSAFVTRGTSLRPNQASRIVYADPSNDLAVVRAARTMPPIYVAFGLQRVDEAHAVEALSAPRFVFGRDVIVPADGPFAVPEAFEQATEFPVQPVMGATHEGDVVTLEVTLPRPGVLVLNEAFTEATTVTEEGKALASLPVNHALLGVPLCAGSHRLRIERHTPGLTEGLGVSLAALLSAIAIHRRDTKRRC